ncbi:MAG: hypothetical protein ACRD7E_25160, partial [Bryobacteraceae bacterium]
VWLDDEERVLPARPEPAECDPEQSVERVQRWPWPLSLEDRELLSERNDFKRNGSAGAEADPKSREEFKKIIDHEPSF